jgi:hypothetical protein
MNIQDWATANGIELPCPVEEIGDEYHSIGDLYAHRLVLTAHLFNEWSKRFEDFQERGLVYKSHRHHDGELCFGGGWFIVVAMHPVAGQISYHYEDKYWELFDIPEVEKPPHPFDGHTSHDVVERLMKALKSA